MFSFLIVLIFSGVVVLFRVMFLNISFREVFYEQGVQSSMVESEKCVCGCQ